MNPDDLDEYIQNKIKDNERKKEEDAFKNNLAIRVSLGLLTAIPFTFFLFHAVKPKDISDFVIIFLISFAIGFFYEIIIFVLLIIFIKLIA